MNRQGPTPIDQEPPLNMTHEQRTSPQPNPELWSDQQRNRLYSGNPQERADAERESLNWLRLYI